MEVIDKGTAEEKLKAMFEALRQRIPEEALAPTMQAMAKNAASRAPSPEQEYDTMMYGGSVGLSTSPFNGGAGAITDSDGRVRFYKPFSFYMANIIPLSYGTDGLMGWAGNVATLDLASRYTYVNYTKISGRGQSHEVNYPFWTAWENGGVFTITPKYAQSEFNYPLRPTTEDIAFRLTKVIPARGMYRGVATQQFVDKILIPRIRKIAQSV